MASGSLIGVDLGGTKIALKRYDSETWEVQAEERKPTRADKSYEHVLGEIIAGINAIKAEDTKAVGIGVPGLVSHTDGIVLTMPNIPGAEGAKMKDALEKECHLPVMLDNDANCFTLAETMQGAAKGHDVVIGVTLGTGVGGGIVINGNIFHGSTGYAAEIGHMLLMPGQPPYETENKRGDVEQFFSGSALWKRCSKAKTPEELLQGSTCKFLHPEVYKEISWLCVNLVHVLDPSIIVLGGSAGRAMKEHLEGIKTEMHNWLLPGTPVPQLAIAELNDSATRGAALLVADR